MNENIREANLLNDDELENVSGGQILLSSSQAVEFAKNYISQHFSGSGATLSSKEINAAFSASKGNTSDFKKELARKLGF